MFHLGVADRIGYACRLLRKAHAQQAKVIVVAPPSTLAELDALLWTSDPTSFVAHARVAPGAATPPAADPTPIWLVDDVRCAPTHDVLLNLGDELVTGFETFARVIEIVAHDDEPAKQAARRRWRHYADRGYPIRRHEARS